MKFEKYRSIENSYREAFVQRIIGQGQQGGEWIASEKIHGSNFSFWCDGKRVTMGKRSGWTGSDFYNCDVLLATYENQIMDMFNSIGRVGVLTVFGELYGVGVQKGVRYPEGRHFSAFDIMIDYEYMPENVFQIMCAAFGIPVVPVIGMGTFQEMLALPHEFNSLILNEPDNVAEGLVIKPHDPKYLADGSRIILKNKSSKFTEKSKEKKKQPPKNFSDNAKATLESISEYITENRLKNVISKEGPIQQKEFGRLNGAFIKDVLEDYQKDNDINLKEFHAEEWKNIQKQIGKDCSTLISSNFLNIIDGNF